jgi:multicomponent Na+:H+ antiporter subunit A
MTMLLAVLALFLLAMLAPLLHRAAKDATGWIVGAAVLALFVFFASLAPAVTGSASTPGSPRIESYAWLPELSIALSLRLDGLSLIFSLLITGIGAHVLIYAGSYFKGKKQAGPFFSTLLAFMAAMLGLVLADNVILVFVFWELTSITSYLLIGFENDRETARKSALQALLTTGIGGLSLLAGLLLLANMAGSFELSAILAADNLSQHPHYTAAVLLILLGCFTKSAQFPFHYWLPNAMEAPSPVSALLHSSTMVKAGVYLIARLHPALSGPALWDEGLAIVGGLTMLVGAYLATQQDALKKVLAYSTVSSLGVLVMLIGLGADKAAAAYLIAHALFKGSLFLLAGSITKKTGLKDPALLAGLRRSMPLTSALAFLAALSMAGAFPLMGFVGKELMLKAGLAHPEWALPAVVATVLAALLTVYAAAVVSLPALLRAPAIDDRVRDAHDPPLAQLLGPALLVTLSIIAGFAPALFAEPAVRATMSSIRGSWATDDLKLAALKLLWPPTTATYLSLAALAVGLALFFARALFRRATAPLALLDRVGPEAGYKTALASTLASASLVTRVLQNGSLRAYVRVTLLAAAGVGIAALARAKLDHLVLNQLNTPDLSGISPLDWATAALIALAAVAATAQRTALAAIAVLGVVGFMVALVFAVYGAPDVAMTQLAVETLVVIIFVLVVWHLPKFRTLTTRLERSWDAVVASIFGALMAGLTLIAAGTPAMPPVSADHVARSVTEAFGRNVVNVILVDFRAFDTLGEVFVLGVAAVGVYTLLRVRTHDAAH